MRKSTLLTFSLLLLAFSSFAYTFETNRTWASTEIFGYDRLRPPTAGKVLRANMFVTLTNTTAKTFHLNDLRVLGYKNAAGEGSTAGVFNFYVPEKAPNGKLTNATDVVGRALSFYWFDTSKHVAGWYDVNGTSRWENLEFSPGQAFVIQSGGYVLEANGLVLDTGVNHPVPPNTHVGVGNAWAKKVNLCDIALTGNGTNDISGGLTLECPDDGPLTNRAVYSWYCVTNGCTSADIRYREPGWYRSNVKSSKVSPADGVVFEAGEAFILQGYQSNPDEAAPELRFKMKPMELDLTEEK